MSNNLEELAELGRLALGKTATAAAKAIQDAGYRKVRTIDTYEALEALPPGTVIRDSDTEAGFIGMKLDEGWHFAGLATLDGKTFKTSHVGLPVTILDGPDPALRANPHHQTPTPQATESNLPAKHPHPGTQVPPTHF